MKICTVHDCGKPTRTLSASLCKKHYHRQYRTGTLELTAKRKDSYMSSHGYIILYAKDHPLTVSSSYVYEHRAVYYNKHGVGPFPCHWCSAVVGWHNLHIDHLDDDKANNSPDNLVASCPGCNTDRGRLKRQRSHWRSRREISFNGKTLCLSEWGFELGISHAAMATRLKKWPIERALTEPRGKTGPRR